MSENAEDQTSGMLRYMEGRLATMERHVIRLERELASVTARLDALPLPESPRVVPMPHRR
ncbi:hypothetical protein ACVFYP_19690 [Roseomonas sp. F4]